MGAEEVLNAVQEMFTAEAEAMSLDTMLYGRCLVVITPGGISRVPPEDWHKLAEDIVLPKKTER